MPDEAPRPRVRFNIKPGPDAFLNEALARTGAQLENEINALIAQWLRDDPKSRRSVLKQIAKLPGADAALYSCFIVEGLPKAEKARFVRGLVVQRLSVASANRIVEDTLGRGDEEPPM